MPREKEVFFDTDENKNLDPDIVSSLENLKNQEAIHGEWNLPKEEDVQLDSESDPICSSAGCTQYLHKHAKPSYAVDYPVPNLGQDRDIADSLASERDASKVLKHNWEFGTKKSKAKWHNPAKDVLYDDAPELDKDIRDSHKHLADAEETLGHKWVIEDVQLNSDPICGTGDGCHYSNWYKKHLDKIVQYPDPDVQGLDEEILHTQQHEAAASEALGVTWIPEGYE